MTVYVPLSTAQKLKGDLSACRRLQRSTSPDLVKSCGMFDYIRKVEHVYVQRLYSALIVLLVHTYEFLDVSPDAETSFMFTSTVIILQTAVK
jgi:hypothetical protein